MSRGEVGEHNGLIHRHFAGSSPAATTIFSGGVTQLARVSALHAES